MIIAYDAKRAFNNNRGLGNYSRDTIRIMANHMKNDIFDLYTPTINVNISFNKPNNAKLIMPKGLVKGSVWRTFGIANETKRRGTSLYHGLSNELPYGMEKTKIPTIVTMHDLIFMRHPELYPFIDRFFYEKKYLHSCFIADRIIAVSKQTKDDIMSFWGISGDKISVVYQGCNPLFQNVQYDSERLEMIRRKYSLPHDFILTVGAIEPRKNHLFLIKTIEKYGIDIPLVIIGRHTSYSKTLYDYIYTHSLHDKILLLENVNYLDMPLLYRCAIVFVYVSLFEGFGIPLVEALKSELPIIATCDCCYEESGGPSSVYVSQDDMDELASAITNVVGDSELRHKMITEGFEYSHCFDDDTIAYNLAKEYWSLLS